MGSLWIKLWFISRPNGVAFLPMEAWVEQNSGRWSCNWHHDQKSDEGQDKDSTGLLCLFDFLDPLFLCWKAVILLDVIFLCDSTLALGIRCKVHWCSWRQAFYFKSNQCPLGTSAFCLLLNFKKCAGDSPPHLAAPCHLVVITVLRFFHAMKTAVWQRVFAHPLVFLFQV